MKISLTIERLDCHYKTFPQQLIALLQSSLLGNLQKAGWLTDGTAYIEFGAGRARLTAYLLQSIPTQAKSSVLLVDRDTTRIKVRF